MIPGAAFRWNFKLVDETDFATPELDATATVTVSKDGAAFVTLTGAPAVSQIGYGWYTVVVPAVDTDYAAVVLRATAAGCAQADESFYPYDVAAAVVEAIGDAGLELSTITDAVRDAVLDAAISEHQSAGTVGGDLHRAAAFAKNKQEGDEEAKTLTVYDDDQVTPLVVFDLDDYDEPTMRTPQ